MANLHITELLGLPAEQNTAVEAVPADGVQATQSLALAAAPGNTSGAFQPNTTWLKLKAGAACAYAVGAAPVAAAGGNFMNAGDTEYVKVPAGLGWKLNVCTDTP
jgi:hypothetical protein